MATQEGVYGHSTNKDVCTSAHKAPAVQPCPLSDHKASIIRLGRAALLVLQLTLLLACLVAFRYGLLLVLVPRPLRHPLDAQISYSWVYANPTFVGSKAARNGLSDNAGQGSLEYTHMGMLAAMPNGSVAAAWQGSPGDAEGSAEQAIFWAISSDGGATWGRHVTLVPPDRGVPVWAPVLHVEDGDLHLFYAVSERNCTWWGGDADGKHWGCGGNVELISSADNGVSWSDPKAVDGQGRWLLPAWRENGGACQGQKQLHGAPAFLTSSDQGETWSVVDVPPNPTSWLIEGAVAGLDVGQPEQKFVAAFRTTLGALYTSVSPDGRTWSPAVPSALPNPNSKVDMTTLPSGELLLAFNDAQNARSPLSLATSSDGYWPVTVTGVQWRRVAVLEDDPDCQFSYPTIQYLPDMGIVLVVYSVLHRPAEGNPWGWDSWGIRVARLPATALLAGASGP